jgi:hypothetical protein
MSPTCPNPSRVMGFQYKGKGIGRGMACKSKRGEPTFAILTLFYTIIIIKIIKNTYV